MTNESIGTYDSLQHEKIMRCVARTLASFRLGLDADDPYDFNEHEMLEAGHIVGRLWVQGFLVGLLPFNADDGGGAT